MAGVYLHIPFCRQACNYCNFHFSTSLKLQNDFSEALLKEIALRKDYLQNESVRTIYFGGGTPSLLAQADIKGILDAIHKHCLVADDVEITLEANPDDITPAQLHGWAGNGINRLSIGVQSFFDADLKWMNRAHDAAQAGACVLMAQDAGISNLSIDLIYGTPALSDLNWEANMSKAVGLGVPHLSCYALTVEPGTALAAMTKSIMKFRISVCREKEADTTVPTGKGKNIWVSALPPIHLMAIPGNGMWPTTVFISNR
jgi:oxygen-independent coproporphyrinogen III oxidase